GLPQHDDASSLWLHGKQEIARGWLKSTNIVVYNEGTTKQFGEGTLGRPIHHESTWRSESLLSDRQPGGDDLAKACPELFDPITPGTPDDSPGVGADRAR